MPPPPRAPRAPDAAAAAAAAGGEELWWAEGGGAGEPGEGGASDIYREAGADVPAEFRLETWREGGEGEGEGGAVMASGRAGPVGKGEEGGSGEGEGGGEEEEEEGYEEGYLEEGCARVAETAREIAHAAPRASPTREGVSRRRPRAARLASRYVDYDELDYYEGYDEYGDYYEGYLEYGDGSDDDDPRGRRGGGGGGGGGAGGTTTHIETIQ